MVGRLPYHWKQIKWVEDSDDRGDSVVVGALEGLLREMGMSKQAMVRVEQIEDRILSLRGHKVMLDTDLAAMYGVATKALNQAVKRNQARFPADFMFQLSSGEAEKLRSQTVTSNPRGGRRTRPFAFTEQGVAMLSSVLRSERAVQVNVQIMRTFVHLRQWLVTHADLARKLEALERQYDKQFRYVFDAIRALMEDQHAQQQEKQRKRIGYLTEATRE